MISGLLTSIVEVSLDIDFDYLFTELTDLKWIISKDGKMQSKRSKAKLDGYNCFVYCDGSDIKQQKGFLDSVFYEQSKKH